MNQLQEPATDTSENENQNESHQLAAEGDFVVRTKEFEGPLALLLELIKKRKLFINDVSLSKVTEDYLEYVYSTNRELKHISDFIDVASTLILIKSKSLLPELDLTDEEKSDIKNLEDRLEKYQRIQALGEYVEAQFGSKMLYSSAGSKHEADGFYPGDNFSPDQLGSAMARVIDSLPDFEITPKARVQKTVRLEDMIDKLHKRIQRQLSMNFSQFVGDDGSTKSTSDPAQKQRVIVGFLALLELVKQGKLDANQHPDGEINIEARDVTTPSYQ